MLPKLSSDQIPGAVITSPEAAEFHAKNSDASVTVSPDECDAAVVPFAPLVNPVKLLLLLPVYVINSLLIKTVPEDGKDVELAILNVVTDVLIPEDKVDVNCPCFEPPHEPSPQPVEATSTAGPTG